MGHEKLFLVQNNPKFMGYGRLCHLWPGVTRGMKLTQLDCNIFKPKKKYNRYSIHDL